MEAKYADGSAAGSANWTTYPEYWKAPTARSRLRAVQAQVAPMRRCARSGGCAATYRAFNGTGQTLRRRRLVRWIGSHLDREYAYQWV